MSKITYEPRNLMKEIREKYHLSSSEFAAMIGVSAENYDEWEQDRSKNLESLVERIPSMLADQRKYFQEFYDRNVERWKKPFDLLELHITIYSGCIENFNDYSEQVKKDIKSDLIIRLCAKACRIAHEIFCLLRNGYADGVYSRWRALYEVVVVTVFLNSQDVECSERFNSYSVVELYKRALKHKDHKDKIQLEGPSDEQFNSIESKYKAAIAKYGKHFGKRYGWALDCLEKKDATFSDIEESIGFEHMKPYYQLASRTIHAGARGLYETFGTSEHVDDVVLLGTSNSGMVIPCHHTAISLSQMATMLFSLELNKNELAIIQVMEDITARIGYELSECN